MAGMKLLKKFIPALIIIAFSFLYIATSKVVPCDDYCRQLYRLDTMVMKNRSYVGYVGSCISGKPKNDTLCISIFNSQGIDWNLFADTVCTYAAQIGMTGQTILVLKYGSPPDTLAKKHCP
jgi:hypothetical protein